MEFALLAGLSDDERRAVLASMRRRRFAKGEVLFHAGDLGDTLHLIAKGKVAVRVTTPRGDVATLAVVSEGHSVGELVLLGPGSRRTATIAALEPVETMTLQHDAFEELRRQYPSVIQVLLNGLTEQVERLSSQLLEALYVPADQRVLRRLDDVSRLYESDIPLTQEELAGLAGTTRPTVNRVLRQCEDAGIVALSRGKIVVLDAAALAKRAGT